MMQATGDPLIICDNLVRIYKVADLEVVALQGLDLVAYRGELLGIVGSSGSGKSTFLNILGGLDRPSAGRIWVDGVDLLKLSDSALKTYRRTKIGFVWQQGARNLIPFLNAQENVELPLTLMGQAPRAKRSRAQELLTAVGLGDRMHHRLNQLSGGEQQRVAIAVALAHNPMMLLADEPTGEVDSATALTIYNTFRELNRNFGLTTLIVSHDQGIAQHVDRVIAIRDGKMASETVRQEVEAAEGETGTGEAAQPAVFQELVVLDSAGRLQVPKAYLEQFDIKGRARIEMVEDGILIRPAPQTERNEAARTPVADLLPQVTSHGLLGRLKHLRRGDHSEDDASDGAAPRRRKP
jgi:putative ABC transport system ATP-binding protein